MKNCRNSVLRLVFFFRVFRVFRGQKNSFHSWWVHAVNVVSSRLVGFALVAVLAFSLVSLARSVLVRSRPASEVDIVPVVHPNLEKLKPTQPVGGWPARMLAALGKGRDPAGVGGGSALFADDAEVADTLARLLVTSPDAAVRTGPTPSSWGIRAFRD